MAVQAVPHPNRSRQLVLVTALVAGFVGYIYVTQSIRSEIPDHGDWWTDTAHLAVAHNLLLYGFSAVGFGAISDNGTEVGLVPNYYSHWPSFPYLVLASLLRLGFSPAGARIAPLLVSSSALIAIFLLARRMLGDWRAGFVAALALAASAPFRLLSDAYGYLSYDFAAETWTMLFITLGCMATGRRRLIWLAAAGVGALATIGLSGFEMVPAIGAYSVIFPLSVSSPWSDPKRLRIVVVSGFFVAAGFLVGAGIRLAQNILLLDGLQPALADFEEAFFRRSSASPAFTWSGGLIPQFSNDYLISYLVVILNRTIDYFPVQLIVIALGFTAGGLLAGVLRGYTQWRHIKWLGVVFFCDVLWFILMRQHTYEHTFTIYHLSLTLSLAAAVAMMMVWQLLVGSKAGRAAVAMVGLGLFVASAANVGVQTRGGNLQIKHDLTPQIQQIEELSSHVPVNGVVVLNVGNMSPVPDLFIGRTYVRRWSVNRLDDSHGRPWFLVTSTRRDNVVYQDSLEKGRLLKETQDLALFDMTPSIVTAGNQ